MDANLLQDNGDPWFLKLFEGCNSTKACQRLIIQFVKDFNLNIHKEGLNNRIALQLAMLHKLFIVVKFLVEKCKVDINSIDEPTGGNVLHMAYGMGKENIAQYLIEHGADQKAVDNCGKKPKDYQFYQNKKNYYIILSKY